MALKKKMDARARKDRVREADEAGEQAASSKVKAGKSKRKEAPEAEEKRSPKAKAAGKQGASAKAAKERAAKQPLNKNKGAGGRKPGGKRVRIAVRGADGQGESDGRAATTADPFEVAKQTVKGSVPAIVEAMVELAKQGSCTHAKTLLEMTGARHMFDGEAEAQESGEPWAKLVLERLDEAESEADGEVANTRVESAESLA